MQMLKKPLRDNLEEIFIAKMSISSKEARETKYWLRLLDKSELTKTDVREYLDEIDQIVKILTSIVKTTKKS